MNVTGSDRADKPVLAATVNRLRRAGPKLQYELFRWDLRKNFLAARKDRHHSRPSRVGFDPRCSVSAPLPPCF